MECIVLAGGLGTRLQGVIGAMPKCMAPVAGQPFLFHLFRYMEQQGCTRIILSLGFKADVVLDWLPQHSWPFAVDHVIETEQLGTGGGIALAMRQAQSPHVAVINGDTMFRADLAELLHFHLATQSVTTLALKHMLHFDRYGVVCTDASQRIIDFEEKRYRESGDINGGIYIIDRAFFSQQQLPEKCSFEKDYLEALVSREAFYGYRSEAYFIDIGIPEDYAQAQQDFGTATNEAS